MTQASFESPHVTLHHGLDLTAGELTRLTARNALAEPEDAWREALMEWRAFAITQAKVELAALAPDLLSADRIRVVMDTAWQLFFPRFHRATGPMIAEAYIKGFGMVRRDEVPIQMIYRLAEEHSDRVGRYFNETSTEALIQGFNTYVNRQVPKRAAIERVLEAYGLTPRQMSGFTSAEALNAGKFNTVTPINLKAKIQQYVSKSIADRLGVFQSQERHNLDEEAKQVAWLWMLETGRIPETTKKMWLTAKDEKVCKQCGPMNAKKVEIREKFKLPNGNELYVPGAHVNCRCQVRLQIDLFAEVGKSESWDPKEHPRGGNPRNTGQFSRRSGEPEVKEREAPSPVLEEMLRGVQEAQAAKPTTEDRVKALEDELRALREAQKPPESELPMASFIEVPTAGFTVLPEASFVEPEPEPPQASFVEPVAEPVLPQASFAEPVAPPSSRPQAAFSVPVDADFDMTGVVQDREKIGQDYQEEGVYTVEERTTYSPTRQLLGRNDEPGIGAVVLSDSDQLSWHQDQVRLMPEIDRVMLIPNAERWDWHRDRITRQYDQNIAEKIFELTGYDYGEAAIYMAGDTEAGHPEELVAYIDRDVVAEAVTRALEMPEDPRATEEWLDSEHAVTINWLDHETGEETGITEDLSWRDVINALDIEPQTYQVVVVHLDKGYADATRIDAETWDAPGSYIATNVKRAYIDNERGQRIPYLSVKAVPDVRTRTESAYIPQDEWTRKNPGQSWPYG